MGMSTIFDIEVPESVVSVGGANVKVQAVSADALIPIVANSRVLTMLFEGEGGDISFDDLVSVAGDAPEAIGVLIAAGTGSLDAHGNVDEKAVRQARRIPVQAQLALLREILALTMPDGPGPFFTELLTTLGLATEESSESASA